MAYILPRPYLSYSAYALWNSSRDGFRRRYYLNEKPFETRETAFGKVIGKLVEDNLHKDDAIVSRIVDYPIKEHKVEVTYKELPLLGYLDQFDDTEFRILEMKTGHKNPQGKAPWDRVKVRKHKQLVFYSVLVKLRYGKVHPDVTLQWLETEFRDKVIEFDGHMLVSDRGDLALTGRIETFTRRIMERERQEMLKDILRTANEIHNDYAKWKHEKN